jgi:rod shape-determining protein MreC
MVMDSRLASFAAFRAALSLPIAPIQYLVSWPTNFIDNMRTSFASRDALLKENTHLKTEQLLLHAKLQRLTAIEIENDYLKSLLRSANKVKGKTLIAELLSVNMEPFVKQVTLNKGTRDGVYLGQPVLDATGVMGQVIQVGPVTSRILLVNDPHSGVAVQNARNGMRAIAVGDSYSGKMQILYVPKTADIQVGDLFITSGLGDHYPEGYPLGSVLSIDRDPAHQFAKVYLQPAAHLESSRQVLLIWYQHDV